MLKFEYKVIKSFYITKSTEGDRKIAENEEEIKSSSEFKKGSMYVDYKFPGLGIEECDLTSELVKNKYIELVD